MKEQNRCKNLVVLAVALLLSTNIKSVPISVIEKCTTPKPGIG